MLGGGSAAGSSADLVLRPHCERCGAPGSSNELFAASCRHMTLCVACGRSMAEAKASCAMCGATITNLIKEYKVKRAPAKQCFLGRFSQGLPLFSKDESLHWTMRKDIPRPTDPAREKFKISAEKLKSKPWILEDDTGAYQFQGMLEGGQQATYYILTKHGRDFHAFQAGPWFNFHKLVQYKQLTLEEAEEEMKKRRKTADGYQRWIMKAANGAAAFGEVEKTGRPRAEAGEDDAKKKGKTAEDDDMAKPEDFDPEDEVDRGDDWEHEETFTDDDEAVGNDPEERDEQPDVPAPPEIKQEEDEVETEEGQTQQGENPLSQSGRDMKKLLGKAGGLEESEEEEDDEDEDMDPDNEDMSSPVLAPTRKDESADASPSKSGARPGGASAAAKNKRKADDSKTAAAGASKKSKVEVKKEMPAVKKETPSTSKKDAGKKEAPKSGAASSAASCALEEEVTAVLKESGPMKSQDLVSRFKARLKNKDEKNAFAMALKKISRILKRDGASYIVLKE